MKTIIEKLVLGEKITDKDLLESQYYNIPVPVNIVIDIARGKKVSIEEMNEYLYEICDSVHASCTDECPVFKLAGNKLLDGEDCHCFKRSEKMRLFIIENS